jgi:hypothetical protein
MQLTCTAWVVRYIIRETKRGWNKRSCQKYESPSLHHVICLSFITSLKSNLRTAQTTYNTTENNCIILHAQNVTTFQPNVFLSRVHRLLVTNSRRSPFPSANRCQGQLQTTQSFACINSVTRLSVRRSIWNLDPTGQICVNFRIAHWLQ